MVSVREDETLGKGNGREKACHNLKSIMKWNASPYVRNRTGKQGNKIRYVKKRGIERKGKM